MTTLGAAGTVTGSCSLVESPEGGRVLVDVGLYQGRKEHRLRNWAPFAFDPSTIDAVVLTHAHVDHCGLLPKLVVEGFTGAVYATTGTARLVRIVLPDSGHLHEEEAAFANRRGYSRHHPALPLYTRLQAEACLAQVVEVPFGVARTVAPGIDVTWRHAGHILGAASVTVHLTGRRRRVVFSGDLGRDDHPLLVAPDRLDDADVVVCETTYGDRDAPEADVAALLAGVVDEAARRGGVVVVPAFAVDRTEMVLHHLDALVRDGRTPSLPVFVDSPMATAALRWYRRGALDGDPEFRPELHGSDLFCALDLTETRSVDDSKALNARHGPMVVISASGMATGGRVLHHLANRLGDSRNTVMLVGFQAPGTRGERLASGERTVRLHGADREVAAKVVSVPLSAHADRRELRAWLTSGPRPPDTVVLTHGEAAASAAFAASLGDTVGRPTVVLPEVGHRLEL